MCRRHAGRASPKLVASAIDNASGRRVLGNMMSKPTEA
jgi:hypothetical protein